MNQIVSQAMTSITGVAVDLTTVAVGAIVIFVLILGAGLLRVAILGGAFDSSEKCDDNSEKTDKFSR